MMHSNVIDSITLSLSASTLMQNRLIILNRADLQLHCPGIIAWQTLFTGLWRWLPLRLLKNQSPTTVLSRTPLTQTITLYKPPGFKPRFKLNWMTSRSSQNNFKISLHLLSSYQTNVLCLFPQLQWLASKEHHLQRIFWTSINIHNCKIIAWMRQQLLLMKSVLFDSADIT